MDHTFGSLSGSWYCCDMFTRSMPGRLPLGDAAVWLLQISQMQGINDGPKAGLLQQARRNCRVHAATQDVLLYADGTNSHPALEDHCEAARLSVSVTLKSVRLTTFFSYTCMENPSAKRTVTTQYRVA